jgi:indolepyruvate ferredoxin oxidoreductase beta subunit
MILSAEPMEALRYLPYLAGDGWLISNSKAFVNISNYPDLEEIHKEISKLPHSLLADAEQLAEEAGSVRTSNMVMLGVASPLLVISEQGLIKGIEKLFASKSQDIIDMNIKAFRIGRDFAKKR